MIALAVQKGNTVYVYDEKNKIIRTILGELYGYTSLSVTVKWEGVLHTYNEKVNLMSKRVV
jgi:hypothetical protein